MVAEAHRAVSGGAAGVDTRSLAYLVAEAVRAACHVVSALGVGDAALANPRVASEGSGRQSGPWAVRDFCALADGHAPVGVGAGPAVGVGAPLAGRAIIRSGAIETYAGIGGADGSAHASGAVGRMLAPGADARSPIDIRLAVAI